MPVYVSSVCFSIINCPWFDLQNNLDELFMLMHFLDAGKVSVILLAAMFEIYV